MSESEHSADNDVGNCVAVSAGSAAANVKRAAAVVAASRGGQLAAAAAADAGVDAIVVQCAICGDSSDEVIESCSCCFLCFVPSKRFFCMRCVR